MAIDSLPPMPGVTPTSRPKTTAISMRPMMWGELTRPKSAPNMVSIMCGPIPPVAGRGVPGSAARSRSAVPGAQDASCRWLASASCSGELGTRAPAIVQNKKRRLADRISSLAVRQRNHIAMAVLHGQLERSPMRRTQLACINCAISASRISLEDALPYCYDMASTLWEESAEMDLRSLRLYLAVLEHGSITKASENVHVAQPALGLHIRKLEEELGLQLARAPFARHPRDRGRRAAGQALPRSSCAMPTRPRRR